MAGARPWGQVLGAFIGVLAPVTGLLSLAGAASAQYLTDPGTVIQTLFTSTWSPPSPDPAGITYRPDINRLLTSDCEVEETIDGVTHYQGVNVWTHSRTGVVGSRATTVAFSAEPTGISFDPAGGRLFLSDDVRHSIFEVVLGPDRIFGTSDDTRVELNGYAAAGCSDLEDVTYDNFDGHLYVAAGSVGICRIGAGANGVFDGGPGWGDDVLTTMSVETFGICDVEGIVYDPFWNTLVLADRGSSACTRDLYELTPDGSFLRKIDVNFPDSVKPSGVTIAPGSTNPSLRNYYVTDRGVDNDEDPDENDGRIYEVVAVPLGGNGAPVVEAGSPQTLQWPENTVNLKGYVSDDGHPYPPSTVTAQWSQQSGPGSVTFGNSNKPVTTASFSRPGRYVLNLSATDSEKSTNDTVEIDVHNSGRSCGFGPELALLGALLPALRRRRGSWR